MRRYVNCAQNQRRIRVKMWTMEAIKRELSQFEDDERIDNSPIVSRSIFDKESEPLVIVRRLASIGHTDLRFSGVLVSVLIIVQYLLQHLNFQHFNGGLTIRCLMMDFLSYYYIAFSLHLSPLAAHKKK